MIDGVWKANVSVSIHISYECKSKRIYLAHERHTGKWTNDIWLRIMSSKHEKCKWLFMIIGSKKWTIKCTTVPPVKTQSFTAAVWESLNKKSGKQLKTSSIELTLHHSLKNQHDVVNLTQASLGVCWFKSTKKSNQKNVWDDFLLYDRWMFSLGFFGGPKNFQLMFEIIVQSKRIFLGISEPISVQQYFEKLGFNSEIST